MNKSPGLTGLQCGPTPVYRCIGRVVGELFLSSVVSKL